MDFAYFIGGLVWAIIWGCAARAIVVNKGYEDEGTKYFWLGFFFAFIPVIVAAAKPQKQSSKQDYTSISNRLEEEKKIVSSGGWKCDCGRINYSYVTTCPCGKNKWETLKKQEKDKEAIKPTIEKSIHQTTEQSIPEQIKEYKELFDAGIITQEEFEAKKKQLLGL